jgi:hypothetical protein
MPEDHYATVVENICQCPECEKKFTIDWDAEYVNGMWRNLSKLHEITMT